MKQDYSEWDIKKGLDGIFNKWSQIDDDFEIEVPADFIPEYKQVGGKNNNTALVVCGLFRTPNGRIVDQRPRMRKKP